MIFFSLLPSAPRREHQLALGPLCLPPQNGQLARVNLPPLRCFLSDILSEQQEK